MKKILCIAAIVFTSLITFTARAASPPSVANVTASQRAGTKLVDIHYDLGYAGTNPVNIAILVSSNSGATWTVPAKTFGGDYGVGISPGLNKTVVWNAGTDWNGQYTANCRVRVLANDTGLVLIPGGSYLRGTPPGLDTDITDAPQYPVYVSPFYIEKNLVTGDLWTRVYLYAYGTAYSFAAGSSKASGHPVQTVSWYDVVKWCNARSEMEGLTPVYYTDAGFTTIYKTGDVAPFVKSEANGYRLPTEAEWEKAARGGSSGKRFPWGNVINQTLANYYGDTGEFSYDFGPNGYNPIGSVGGTSPATSPVGSFAANGYGLFDMAGNVWEWCWDWYGGSYYAAGQTDPQGPGSGSQRVLRGGAWFSDFAANVARCASRYYGTPSYGFSYFGFRCVRGL